MAPSMGNAGKMLLSAQYKKERIESRRIFLKILYCVRYLARQSLPMLGNWSEKSISEFNANFNQLLLLRCEGDPEMAKWLERKRFRYTFPLVQNEILEVLALGIMRKITENIIVQVLKDVFLRMNLDVKDSRGLCYDGAVRFHQDLNLLLVVHTRGMFVALIYKLILFDT